MWHNFLPISTYIFTIKLNNTYKLGKHTHLAQDELLEIPEKVKRSTPYCLAAMFLNSYKVNSYSSSQNTLRLIYEIE